MDKSFISKDQWNHPCCVAIQTNNVSINDLLPTNFEYSTFEIS